MKKNIIGLVLLLGLFIGGCAKKIEKPIIFDQYYITLSTEYTYKEITTNTDIGSSVIKQYIQEIDTGFVGSIIIAKNKLQTGLDIITFSTNNIKSITRKITGARKPSIDEFSFECIPDSIDGVLQKFVIKEGEQTQYLNQIFFVDKNYLYGISTITTDKGESKNLAKSIKKITCPTNKQ